MTTIKTKQKEDITSLFNTVLKFVRYVKINKNNEKNIASSAPVDIFAKEIQQERAFWRTCINEKYIDLGSMTYYNNQYWIRFSELYAKYALKHKKSRGLKQNFIKTVNKLES